MLSEGFLSGLYIAFFGFIAGIAALCYKSKCKHIECCCFKIVRDTDIELKEDISMDHREEAKSEALVRV